MESSLFLEILYKYKRNKNYVIWLTDKIKHLNEHKYNILLKLFQIMISFRISDYLNENDEFIYFVELIFSSNKKDIISMLKNSNVNPTLIENYVEDIKKIILRDSS